MPQIWRVALSANPITKQTDSPSQPILTTGLPPHGSPAPSSTPSQSHAISSIAPVRTSSVSVDRQAPAFPHLMSLLRSATDSRSPLYQSQRPRLARLARHLSWSVADQITYLGLPRIVLFPLLARLLGAQSFGDFILALSFVHLVGLSPTTGLSAFIVRDAATHNTADQALLMRTMLLLCLAATSPFLVAAVAGAPLLAHAYNAPNLATLLPILGLYLLALNLIETSLTIYRVRRAFRYAAFVHILQVSLLFLALPFCWLAGIFGAAYAYAFAGALTSAALILRDRSAYFSLPAYSPDFVRRAFRVWLGFSISSLVLLSADYFDRILLGYWWSTVDVAVYFAAVGTARIFSMPATLLSSIVLSLLGRMSDRHYLPLRFHVYYAIALCASAALVYATAALAGKTVLFFLYPALAARALPLWNYAAAASAVLVITLGCRPFVVRYLPIKTIPILTAAAVTSKLPPLFLLVPARGSLGAVQAVLIGSSLTAVLWLAVYIRAFACQKPPSIIDSPPHHRQPPAQDSRQHSIT